MQGKQFNNVCRLRSLKIFNEFMRAIVLLLDYKPIVKGFDAESRQKLARDRGKSREL